MAQMLKKLPAVQETQLPSLDWEDPLEKEMANLSSILALETRARGPWWAYSPWGHKESDMTERVTSHFHTDIK